MKNVLFDGDGSGEAVVGISKAASILQFSAGELEYLERVGALTTVKNPPPGSPANAQEKGDA